MPCRQSRLSLTSRTHATVTFKAVGDAYHPAQLLVGDHQAGAVPIADTDPAPPPDTFRDRYGMAGVVVHLDLMPSMG